MENSCVENGNAQFIALSETIARRANQLFLSYGIKAVTMDDIAVSLSISKKTIYKVFANKKTLVEALIDKVIVSNEANYKALIENEYDAVAELFLILAGIKNLYMKVFPAVMRELENSYPIAFKKLKDHIRLFVFEAIRSSITKGITEAVYRNDFDIELRADFFIRSVAIISDLGTGPIESRHLNDLAEDVFDHLIGGIATVSGVKLIARYKNKHRIHFLFKLIDKHLSETAI